MKSFALSRRTVVKVSARYSGGRRGPGGESGLILGPGNSGRGARGQPQRLVLPGQQNAPGQGQRLFVPDSAPTAPRQGSGMLDLQEPANAPAAGNRFRPPPGFMDKLPGDEVELKYSASELLSKLRSRAGYWHQLAKFFPALNKLGYDSNSIDQDTGISPATQNKWMVGATVYDTLVECGRLDEQVLRYYNQEDGDLLLTPFRFLGLEMRVAAANYIVANKVEAEECEVLARSMKEWERRPSERYGFTDHPADCLAFKYLRDAGECRGKEERVAFIQKAMNTAVTETAKARLAEALEAEEAPQDAAGIVTSLTVLRLEAEEVGFRPLPLLGSLIEARASDFERPPRARQSGPFGGFTIEGNASATTWLTLPMWKALAMASTPVALSVSDCASVPAIVAAAGAKSEEERKRVAGPALLVLETGVASAPPQEDCLYVAGGEGGRLRLVGGTQLVAGSGLVALAKVLFMCRPPKVEVEATPDFLML